jgi:predicted MFS family arabinose efflux permease
MRLGFRVWQSLFNNFAVEEIGVRVDQMGLIQAIREVPGLMGILVGLLALVLVEMRIAGLSLVMLGAGILLTSFVQSVSGLILASLVLSVGFHFFTSSSSSALLLTVGHDEAPTALGRLNSLGAAATLVGTAVIFVTLEAWGYRTLLLVAGAVVLIGGVILLPFGRQEAGMRQSGRRKTLRRRYWLFYALTFMMGSRRHIFSTFAVFLLVQEYQVTPHVITFLFLINSLVGTYLHQAFGRIIARYGERRVLTANFVLLTPIFLGYALIPLLQPLASPQFQIPALAIGEWVLFPALDATPGLMILLGFFILDQILFGFSIALRCYLRKIVISPADITPNVSMGQTINHVAAVIVPIAGGAVWAATGAQYTFLAGVIIALISLGLTRFMRSEELSCSPSGEKMDVLAEPTR